MTTAKIRFHGALQEFLSASNLLFNPDRNASVKDIIEAHGPPHTEIGKIHLDGVPVDFHARLKPAQTMDVFPVEIPWDVRQPTLLRPRPLSQVIFLVDENVHRLAKLLRVVGLDAADCKGMGDSEIAAEAERSSRILLSRDHHLLKRSRVTWGRLVRSQQPWEQLSEILNLFGLKACLRPFTRCVYCNCGLQARSKEEVLDRLEPLTKRYYDTFFECSECNRIFWPGSHHERLMDRLQSLGIK
ncbi:Mut7-C RNAse domain-containing protein [Desulfonatronum thioautotrophicum]|uniref:Mut7-C RNAse domain-containing protein n=1 Tax=Desulfonatronum thioautotrophicum TaxID=617001 RepID=UPI0005EB4B65|nr:Mut7-C RNAse domain-containing protein [Desulfonatronum thioautotrophicum]